MISALVTGGAEGVGKDIVDFFGDTSLSLSRRNGCDISEHEGRLSIVELSLQHDIFVNLAYDGTESQVELLFMVFKEWENKNKNGYIFNIGSYSTYSLTNNFKRYAVAKYMLDEASHQCSKKTECRPDLPFRVTLIRPGMLDTEKSRKKPHWEGNGVRGIDIAKLMYNFYLMPKDLQVADIVIESRKES